MCFISKLSRYSLSSFQSMTWTNFQKQDKIRKRFHHIFNDRVHKSCILSYCLNYIGLFYQKTRPSNHGKRYQTTYHTRPLPSHLIALSSPDGRKLFREALELGCLESFFPLSEQFITQSEPSFCSISSLAMTLNALKYDPKKVWKGAWRWVSEETLICDTAKICGHSLENIKTNGMSFSEFEALGECHGISIQSVQVTDSLHHPQNTVESSSSSSSLPSWHQPNCVYSIESFRKLVKETSSSLQANTFIIVNFSRKQLGQTGDGHFSPIGGYHPVKDLVLIMDVARFKYPPFWVSLPELWESMAVVDKKTETTRGYFILSTNKQMEESSCNEEHEMGRNHNHNHSHDHIHVNTRNLTSKTKQVCTCTPC